MYITCLQIFFFFYFVQEKTSEEKELCESLKPRLNDKCFRPNIGMEELVLSPMYTSKLSLPKFLSVTNSFLLA